jgi:DNA-directed RNA polymerase specialized sigma24 family protein
MMAPHPHALLGDPVRVRALTRVIRAKIPARDVEDVVQSILADALAAPESPPDAPSFDRWLHGIARHKIADYYRRHRRNEVLDPDALERDPDASANTSAPSPESARDLLRWVDAELPRGSDAPRTLEWMLREASGDRLETIAEEHALPAPAVRQRVSRLRRYLRERWALQLAAALGLCVVITGVHAYRTYRVKPTVRPDLMRHEVTAAERARQIREAALDACRATRWQSCLDELERAKRIDPAGDAANDVEQARMGALRALQTPTTPGPTPSADDLPKPSPSVPPGELKPIKPPTKVLPTKAPRPNKPAQIETLEDNSSSQPINRKAAPTLKQTNRKNSDDINQKRL